MKIFRINIAKDLEASLQLASFKIIIKGLVWILRNYRYINNKRKQVNSRRVRTTSQLIEMGLITRWS